MLGATHRLLGFAAGAGVAALAGYDLSEVVLSGAFASASSAGALSPDVDQTRPWVAFRRFLPSGQARLLGHRRLSHWWALPVVVYFTLGALPVEFRWATTMLLVGWSSHIAGDFIFGKIPLDPEGRYTFGIGLNTGGFWETGVLKVGGRTRKISPFGPARALLGVGIVTLFLLVLPVGSTDPSVTPKNPVTNPRSTNAPNHPVPRHRSRPRGQ